MDATKRLLARNHDRRGFRRFMSVLRQLQLGYENLSYDFRTNGEQRVLRLLAVDAPVRTVLDVGANTGGWSLMAAAAFPAAEVHAFEIVPDTAEVCRRATAAEARIRFNAIGLSDREGSDEVHIAGASSPIATCVPGFADDFHHVVTTSIPVETTTGDLYCARHGIESIDLLKIDVEGLEHRVLAGFAGMLERRAVRAVQFEYGYVNVATRFLLKDFYELLLPLGMTIGKIYPTYVDFRPYRYRDEDFLGPNYLAVLESEVGLVERLRARDPAR